jgi:hypothetical protein
VKLPSEYGFGDNAHAAITDFGHKIHYLNWLRQDTYFEYLLERDLPRSKQCYRPAYLTHRPLYRYSLAISYLRGKHIFNAICLVWGSSASRNRLAVNRKFGDLEGILHWSRERSLNQRVQPY